jgi:hypothetical protein
MVARYAKSYVDRLYETKDIFALHGVISVVGRECDLPKQFSLFLRIWDWCCSTRSGIWQYYECLSTDKFESLAQAMEQFGLQELAERYRSGMNTWREPEKCAELDSWIDGHWSELEVAAFQLIADGRDYLYDES